MNDQTQNNQPTFVFKTSSVSSQTAENMTRVVVYRPIWHTSIRSQTKRKL